MSGNPRRGRNVYDHMCRWAGAGSIRRIFMRGVTFVWERGGRVGTRGAAGRAGVASGGSGGEP